MDYNAVVDAIDKPDGKSKLVKKYQDTHDIIKDLIFCFKQYNSQAKPVVELVKTGDVKVDGKNIYDFIKKNIKYYAEKDQAQTTRSFSRIINDKWGDCKHSALIVSSIGFNEGYNVIFRFVSYVKGESYGHVYAILEDDKTKERIIVDPLQDFNYEKSFYKHKDFKAYNNPNSEKMALSRLTGVDDGNNTAVRKHKHAHAHKHGGKHMHTHKHGQHMPARTVMHELHPKFETRYALAGVDDVITGDGCDHCSIGGVDIFMQPNLSDKHLDDIAALDGIGRKTKAQRKAARSARKSKRKERGGLLKAVALAPVRAAFSGLILLNFKGFATKMKQAAQKDEGKVKAFAKKFGYKFGTFMSQVERGAKKKSLGEISGYVKADDVQGMGFVVTATAVAAAAPAIVIAVKLFKMLGVAKPGDDSALATAVNDVQSIAEGRPIPDSGDSGSVVPRRGGGGDSDGGDEVVSKKGKSGSPDEEHETAKKFLGLPTPVLVIGAGVILVVAGKIFKFF